MDLYVPITVINSSEFSGSEPVDRATWLCLMAYCCHMENGGRILECSEWGDRRWQQTCKVMLAEVTRTCDLWHWEEFNLVVTFYPQEKQDTHQRLSQKGKEAALGRWERERGLSDAADVENSGSRKPRSKMPAALPLEQMTDANGSAVLEGRLGIKGVNGSKVGAAGLGNTIPHGGLASTWAEKNSSLVASMIAQWEKAGTEIIDVLRFWKAPMDLKGTALNGEWIEVTKGQIPVEVALVYMNSPQGAIHLPSSYRTARKAFEITEQSA